MAEGHHGHEWEVGEPGDELGDAVCEPRSSGCCGVSAEIRVCVCETVSRTLGRRPLRVQE